MKAAAAQTLDFNAAIQGAAAELDVEIPWLIVKRPDGIEGPLACKVRALNITENAAVRDFATQWCKDHGRPDASRGDDVFDEAEMMASVAVAYLDPDSPKHAREPTFAGPTALTGMFGERLAYLYARVALQQSKVSPFTHELPAARLFELARETVESIDDRPFLDMSPYTQLLYVRGLAHLLLASPEVRSLCIGLSSVQDSATKSGTATTKTEPVTEPPSKPLEKKPDAEKATRSGDE